MKQLSNETIERFFVTLATMLFSEVIGQKELKKELMDSVKTGRVSHAQLFLGSLGHGGMPLALAYAQYLNCENRQENDSCGKCPSCSKAQKLIHPDIHYSFPFPSIEKREKSNDFIKEWREAVVENPYLSLHDWMAKFDAENKQANIPVKECWDILKKLSLKAYESPFKILILWLPEYLGKEGNTLLKILEEPPANTVFILVGEKRDSILTTIISRTQIVKIKNIERQDLTAAVQHRFEISENEASKISAIANGNYIEAVNMLKNSVNEMSDIFREWLMLCVPNRNPKNAIEIFQWVEKFAAIGRENQKSFFSYGLYFLREMLFINLSGRRSELLTKPELEFAESVKEVMNFEKCKELDKLFNSSHYHLERNASPKILMMNVSLKTAEVLKENKLILA